MSECWDMEAIAAENAKIEETFLGIEDHGIFTFTLLLRTGSGKCFSVGGYVAARPGLGATLARLLRVVGVSSWELLRGKHVRVTFLPSRLQLESIGHLMESEWLPVNRLGKLLEGQEATDAPQ